MSGLDAIGALLVTLGFRPDADTPARRAIESALRQREQETAAASAMQFWEVVRERLGLDYDQRVYNWHDVVDACEAARLSVLSRFPKDQG